MPTTMSREELLDAIEKDAASLEKEYHGCSRCVLIPLQKHLGIGNSAVARAAAPLAGGIALTGETCGALLGGLLAVGLVMADDNIEDNQAFLDTMAAGFRFHRRFQKAFEATTCRDLQTAKAGRYYSMAKPEEYEEFVALGGYEICSALVGKAARLAAEYILELNDKGALRVKLSV